MSKEKNPGSIGGKMRAGCEPIVVHSKHDRQETMGAIPDVSAPSALSTLTRVVTDAERSVLFYVQRLPATEEILEEVLHYTIYFILEVQTLFHNKSN